MPLFDFVCKDCASTFEDLVRNGDCPPCPFCGSGNVEKKISCCAHLRGGDNSVSPSYETASPRGCGSCAGGNCASCGR